MEELSPEEDHQSQHSLR